MLTTRCVNSCKWCFAQSIMHEYCQKDIGEMSWQNFLTAVDFYEQTRLKEIVLLGGEPTLHSRFIEILKLLALKDFKILVVTNGILPVLMVDSISLLKISDLRFIINLTSYFDYEAKKKRMVDYFLENINHPVLLSYTITETDVSDFDVAPILDSIFVIMRFSLEPHIQFQIAVPAENNQGYVPFDKYGDVVQLLTSWFNLLKKNNVSFALDCHCIPKCAIQEDLDIPYPLKSKCTNFMIDIGPDLDVWPCFPLSHQRVKLDQFKDFEEIQAMFSEINSAESLKLDTSCKDCNERLKKECDAGCRGFHLLRTADMVNTFSPLKRGKSHP